MSKEYPLNETDLQLERALRSFTPRPVFTDPLTAAFEAGRNRERRKTRLWRGAAAGLLAFAMVGWTLQWYASDSRSAASAPGLARTTSILLEPVDEPMPSHSLLAMQRAFQHGGVDGLPSLDLPKSNEVVTAGRL